MQSRKVLLVFALLATLHPDLSGLGAENGADWERYHAGACSQPAWQKQCEIPPPPGMEAEMQGHDQRPELGVLIWQGRKYRCIRSGQTFTLIEEMYRSGFQPLVNSRRQTKPF